jgi:hypothetical protein
MGGGGDRRSEEELRRHLERRWSEDEARRWSEDKDRRFLLGGEVEGRCWEQGR